MTRASMKIADAMSALRKMLIRPDAWKFGSTNSKLARPGHGVD